MRYPARLLALTAVLAIGCDGDDDDDAPAQCERYIQALCEHEVVCGAASVEACRAEVEADPLFPDTGCATAKRIRDRQGLVDCLEALPDLDCEAELPSSCVGQIVFPG